MLAGWLAAGWLLAGWLAAGWLAVWLVGWLVSWTCFSVGPTEHRTGVSGGDPPGLGPYIQHPDYRIFYTTDSIQDTVYRIS